MPNTVLIVDDEPSITVALMTRLEAHGYRVYHAINGLAGVEAAALHQPDAIIMDVRIPDINGFDAFERIQRMPGLGRVPIIFLSANSQDAQRKRADSIGAAAFFSKPYEPAEIIAALESKLTDRLTKDRRVSHV